jgi:hypothetical protein
MKSLLHGEGRGFAQRDGTALPRHDVAHDPRRLALQSRTAQRGMRRASGPAVRFTRSPAFLSLIAACAACGTTAKTSASSGVCADGECSDGAAGDTSPPALGCTLIGCNDGASIVLDSPTGSWGPGTYAVAVSADGTTANCTLTVPAPATGDVFGTCTSGVSGPGLSLSLEFAKNCVTIDAGNPAVTGVQCTPILGQSSLQLGVPGTPANVMLVVTLDGAQLASVSIPLQYSAFFPNGQACGGACQAASATLTVSAMGSGATSPGDGGADSAPDA